MKETWAVWVGSCRCKDPVRSAGVVMGVGLPNTAKNMRYVCFLFTKILDRYPAPIHIALLVKMRVVSLLRWQQTVFFRPLNFRVKCQLNVATLQLLNKALALTCRQLCQSVSELTFTAHPWQYGISLVDHTSSDQTFDCHPFVVGGCHIGSVESIV